MNVLVAPFFSKASISGRDGSSLLFPNPGGLPSLSPFAILTCKASPVRYEIRSCSISDAIDTPSRFAGPGQNLLDLVIISGRRSARRHPVGRKGRPGRAIRADQLLTGARGRRDLAGDLEVLKDGFDMKDSIRSGA